MGLLKLGLVWGTKMGLLKYGGWALPKLMKLEFGKIQFECIFPNQDYIRKRSWVCQTLTKVSKIPVLKGFINWGLYVYKP